MGDAMRAAPRLQQIVMQLAEKHGMNLKNAGAYLRLAMPGFGQLVVENIGADRVSIANYVQVHTDWRADPEIVVFVANRPSRQEPGKFEQTWFPIEVTGVMGGWQLYGEVDTWGEIALYDPAGQSELADYADHVVARNLVAGNWLENGEQVTTPVAPWTPDEIRIRDIRTDVA